MPESPYVLATGGEAEYRLGIVNEVHGADTREFLLRAGLREGMRVADIGCGVGIVSEWIAQQIGDNGELTAVDISPRQIDLARMRLAEKELKSVRFAAASADSTGLDADGFDLVYCRFVLMHMDRPEDGLAEMRRILKPGGILAVEDGDFASPWCYPPLSAFDRAFQLYRALGERRNQRFLIGRELYRLVLQAGFREPQVTLAQPVFVRGDAKRLPEWTLMECAPALTEAGISSQEEIISLTSNLRAYAEDESSIIAMARMTQVWAAK